jgi:hypothetical protein
LTFFSRPSLGDLLSNYAGYSEVLKSFFYPCCHFLQRQSFVPLNFAFLLPCFILLSLFSFQGAACRHRRLILNSKC